MPTFIYTHAQGTSAVQDTILETLPFSSTSNAVQHLLQVSQGDTIEFEEQLAKKYADHLFVNQKKSGEKQASPSDVKRVLALFYAQAKGYYENTLFLTKHMLSEAVTFESLIIQSSNSVEELTKIANLLAKRLREWYELYNPEFSKAIPDHKTFAQTIGEKTREELLADFKTHIPEEKKWARFVQLQKEPVLGMGGRFSETDILEMQKLAAELLRIFVMREETTQYIDTIMKHNCPNISAVAGTLIGAKMLTIAGSLHRMVILPASTIQLLGAEKALFRHMKTGAKPPKYGILLQHQFVASAKKANRGKVARELANKISLCAKLDYYKGEFLGDKLLLQIQEKLKKLQ